MADPAPPPAPRRESNDPRGSLSKGVQWASVGTTIAMEMAGAPLIGWLIDTYLTGTFPLFLLLFTAVGFWLGITQLLAAVKKGAAGEGPSGGMRGPRR